MLDVLWEFGCARVLARAISAAAAAGDGGVSGGVSGLSGPGGSAWARYVDLYGGALAALPSAFRDELTLMDFPPPRQVVAFELVFRLRGVPVAPAPGTPSGGGAGGAAGALGSRPAGLGSPGGQRLTVSLPPSVPGSPARLLQLHGDSVAALVGVLIDIGGRARSSQ